MRRQYHGRHIGGKYLVWDIHRLVELSRNLQVVDVDAESILEREQDYWFSFSTPATPRNVAEHAKLIAETELSYPIILCPEHRVMDGMHRVCKAWNNGQKTLKAVQFTNLPSPDYVDVELSDLPYDEPW